MRKGLWIVLVLLLVGRVWGLEEVIDRETLSLKAGPTEPGESLSLVWVEALVYPKVVENERIISLGLRVTSKVAAVKATFDFNSDRVALSSNDGMSWSGAYKIPNSVSTGVHVVRYQIIGVKGSIQRTVEFFIKEQVRMAMRSSGAWLAKRAPGISQGEIQSVSGWPLTVTSTCAALTGGASRILYAGQRLTGLSKVPGYKILFEDGEEGWLPAAKVKEPTEDYYRLGYEAYKAKNYTSAIKFFRNAVAVNPEFLKGYLWLAKSYAAQGELDSASEAIRKAMQLDERDIDSRVVVASLAQRYFSLAHNKFKSGCEHEAVATYRKVLDLKPTSILSWIEMGESLRRLGLESEARSAWREALKYDSENQELRALLQTASRPEVVSKPSEEVKTRIQVKAAVSPLIVNDSLAIVREQKTNKGTKIEAAIKSVVALTKSLGTPIAEKGWQIRKQGEKLLVSYLCEQSGGALESFDWLVDVDTRQALPHNENARLLMSRW